MIKVMERFRVNKEGVAEEVKKTEESQKSEKMPDVFIIKDGKRVMVEKKEDSYPEKLKE